MWIGILLFLSLTSACSAVVAWKMRAAAQRFRQELTELHERLEVSTWQSDLSGKLPPSDFVRGVVVNAGRERCPRYLLLGLFSSGDCRMCLRDEVVEWESVCELAKHKVLVVGLCIDSSRASVLRFQTLYSPSFPVLHLPAAADMLRPPATPATVLVNEDGIVIAACASGAGSCPEFYARVRDLVLGTPSLSCR